MASSSALYPTSVNETKKPNLLAVIFGNIVQFLKALSRNKAGFIGFLGLCFYVVFTFILPYFIPFDSEVKLDQVAGSIGERMQLVTRAEDASTFTSFESLNGHTIGAVLQTGGPSLVAPYEDSQNISVETYRFEDRRRGTTGYITALEALADGETDAVIMYSRSYQNFVAQQTDPELAERFSNLVVSNPTLGAPYLLGTDTQGRDIFSHIVHGGRNMILVALVAALISTVIAVILGTLSALLGGVFDSVVSWITNIFLAIPRFPLLVVLAGLVRLNDLFLLAVLIGILSWPSLTRAIRSQVMTLRERDYVEAAQALDLGLPHIMFREILPNMISYVVINLIFLIIFSMYEQVGLVVLGLAPINDYTWGVMLYFGRSRGTLYNPDGASMALAPVMAIALFQIFLVLFARALEEMFDPRLRS